MSNIDAAGTLPVGPAPSERPTPPSEVSTGATNGDDDGDANTAAGSAAGTSGGTGADTEKFAPPGMGPRRKLAQGGGGFNANDPAFIESNLMHGMNGFVYGNLPVCATAG